MLMKETFNRTGTYNVDHSTFGGLIHPSDFNTAHSGKKSPNGSAMAGRIISDRKFVEQCRHNAVNRQNAKKAEILSDYAKGDRNNAR